MGANGPAESPRRIGRYDVRRELGRGMMGVVYEAYDPALGRTIALKTIHIAFALDAKERQAFEKRFFAEARIAARLSHPGIVMVHDVGRDAESGLLYMALEYLEGETLSEVIERGLPLAWLEVLPIVKRVAEALHHAHDHGVIHRDVKPGNIMLLRSGEAKIMDFGVAKAETARIKLTAAGEFFGTPLYMSPEQVLGLTVDRRSDLFSLGSIAYSLLAGKAAFAAENITKIVTRVVQDEAPPPSQVVGDMPPEVDYVVARSLAKNPDDRYPDGQTMAEDVDDILAGRRPRHWSEWAVPGAQATLVAAHLDDAEIDLDRLLAEENPPRAEAGLPTVDLEAQLATLIPNASSLSSVDELTPRRPAPVVAELEVAGRVAQAPASKGAAWGRRLSERFETLTMGLILLLTLGALLTSMLARRPDAAKAPRPQAGSAARPSAPSVEPAQLAIDFEHSLKIGLLRIWLDRELVVEQTIDGGTKRITAFKFRSGDLRDVIELPPGGHDVEVQVAWDDSQRTERIWGDFRSGTKRRLQGRLGGLFKSLSLEWH